MYKLWQLGRIVLPGTLGLLAYGYGFTPLWGVVAGFLFAVALRGLWKTICEEDSEEFPT